MNLPEPMNDPGVDQPDPSVAEILEVSRGLKPFDPTRFLSTQRGKKYLEVKWRLVWLLNECRLHKWRPVWSDARFEIDWELKQAWVSIALEIYNEEGELIARGSGLGTEDATDFGDYPEKAETKAVGRCLAKLGYGQEFTQDMELPNAVVDSPMTTTPSIKPPVIKLPKL